MNIRDVGFKNLVLTDTSPQTVVTELKLIKVNLVMTSSHAGIIWY